MQENTYHSVIVTRAGSKVGEHTVKVVRISQVALLIDGQEFKSSNGKIHWLNCKIEAVVQSGSDVELQLPMKLAKQLNLIPKAAPVEEPIAV